jgi:hypothetical protein
MSSCVHTGARRFTSGALMRRIRSAVVRMLRCHPLTWVVTMVVGLAVVLIAVPGQSCHAPFGEPPSRWDRQVVAGHEEARRLYENSESLYPAGLPVYQPLLFEHGWPLPAFVRAKKTPLVVMAPVAPVSMVPRWSKFASWPFEMDAWRVHWDYLAVDLVVLLLIVGVVAVLLERWIRRRGGLLRVRMVDLLVAVAVASVMLGWWQYHAAVKATETNIDALINEGHKYNRRPYRAYAEYQGPDWLRRLVGNAEYLPFCKHITHVALYRRDTWRRDLEQLEDLPYLQHLSISSAMPRSALASLKRRGRLESLSYRMYSPPGETLPGSCIQYWLNADADPELIGPSDLAQLGDLKLRELRIDGYMLIVDDLIRLLEGHKHLEQLSVGEASITMDEYDDLQRRFSRVHIQWKPATNQRRENEGSKPYVRRLENLRQLKQLRRGKG